MTEPVRTRNEASVAGFEPGAAGVTPPSSRSGRQGVFLTDILVELGFTDEAQVDEAEGSARSSGKTVEQLLLDRGAIDESQLSLAIAERNGLDHVDLGRFEVDMRAAATVGRQVAASCGAVPIACAPDGALVVAVQDAFDSLAIRRIETATGAEARPVVATVSAIERLIERLPDEAPAEPAEPEVPRLRSQRELQVEGPDGSEGEDAEATAPPAQPAAEDPRPERREAAPASFDGLSMDLGPMTMESGAQQAEEGKPADEPEVEEQPADDEGAPVERVKSKKLKKAAKREERMARELIETKGRVAELERQLEEVLDAAEEATATSEKLRALRRAIAESA